MSEHEASSNPSEDHVAERDLSESDPPPEGGIEVFRPQKQRLSHPDVVRLILACAMIVILALTVAGGWWGWHSGKNITDWTSFTAPVFTLSGVALTFYFTRDKYQ